MTTTDPSFGPSKAAPAPSTLHVSKSAERALRLLDIVITRGPMTLGDAAAATDMATSTALRHLRGLATNGYLIRDELGRFSVGPTFMRLALAAFRSGPYARLTAAAQPHLERLAATTEESAYLAVRDGTMAVYIATVESPRAIRHVGWVGRSVPMLGTAVGRALSASPPDQGAAPTMEFNTGSIEADVTAVCAPIFGTTTVTAALSILGPADRLTGERLTAAAEALTEAAASVGDQLSAPVPGSTPSASGDPPPATSTSTAPAPAPAPAPMTAPATAPAGVEADLS